MYVGTVNCLYSTCMLSCFSHVQLFAILWTIAARLLCPWDSPDKNTGVGCHAILQGIFLTQRSNPGLLHWQTDSLPAEPPERERSESRSSVSDSLQPHGLYTVHGTLQARILEWVVMPSSRGSSQARDQTQVSCIAGRFFTS